MNLWLAERGWAFPAYYSSMSAAEIRAVDAANESACRKRRGVWRWLSADASRLDASVVYRGPVGESGVQCRADAGPVIIPKVFRRLCAWWVNHRAGLVRGSLVEYPRAHADGCYDTREFLGQGVTAARRRRLDEYVGADGKVRVAPGGLVFQEAPADLVGKGGSAVRW